MINLEIPTLKVENLGDQVYLILKNAILSRQLTPGQRLDLQEIGAKLGISRTPVKDALNRLKSEGLIEIVPRSGTYVTKLTPSEVREDFEIRLMIERYAAENLFQHLSDENLVVIKKLISQMEVLYDQTSGSFINHEAFFDLDTKFHLYLVSIIGNTKLVKIYETLKIQPKLIFVHYLAPSYRDARTIEFHRHIVNAILEKNQEQLLHYLTDHIKIAQESVLNILTMQLLPQKME